MKWCNTHKVTEGTSRILGVPALFSGAIDRGSVCPVSGNQPGQMALQDHSDV